MALRPLPFHRNTSSPWNEWREPGPRRPVQARSTSSGRTSPQSRSTITHPRDSFDRRVGERSWRRDRAGRVLLRAFGISAGYKSIHLLQPRVLATSVLPAAAASSPADLPAPRETLRTGSRVTCARTCCGRLIDFYSYASGSKYAIASSDASAFSGGFWLAWQAIICLRAPVSSVSGPGCGVGCGRCWLRDCGRGRVGSEY